MALNIVWLDGWRFMAHARYDIDRIGIRLSELRPIGRFTKVYKNLTSLSAEYKQ